MPPLRLGRRARLVAPLLVVLLSHSAFAVPVPRAVSHGSSQRPASSHLSRERTAHALLPGGRSVPQTSVAVSREPSAVAAPTGLGQKLKVLVGRARALARGAIHDGPRHSLRAIKDKPAQYLGLLAAIGGAGAAARAFHVDPEPWALGASGLIFGFQLWKSLPRLMAARGEDRWHKVGADVVWPAALVVGTAAGGKLVGHTAAHGPATTKQLVRAGLQTIIIGADAPTIAQTALATRTADDVH